MATSINELTDNQQHWTASPNRADYQQQELPDSPIDKYSTNSDDLQPTSNLHLSSSYYNYQRIRHNLVIVGCYEKPVTLGRGGACTIKIGRRNRQVSRVHLSIAFNNHQEQFELTVLGMNGACVDNVQYDQHAVVPLDDNSFVDVLGDRFLFRIPPPPMNFSSQQEEMKKKEMMRQEEMNQDRSMDTFNNHIEPKSIHMEKEVKKGQEEEEKEEEEEEESYPSELVPEGALTPFEKELSPEQDMSVPEATKQKEEKVKNTEILIEKKEENEMKKVEEEKKEEIKKTEEEKKNPASDAHDYAEVIIDALVFSRTSSMPISDICSRILKANPAYAEQPREIWIERIRTVLKDKPFFGEIQRKGKTADGSPKENLYYYNSELDPVEWRRATYTQVGRSARKCTLKDKQYFWKIPPKLGRHRNSYIPPPASEHKRQRAARQQGSDENVEPKKAKHQ